MLKAGTVSTNVYLRRIHNYAVNMHWLPWPVMPKRNWPAVHCKSKRAITREEHEKIIEREKNPAISAYYELCWHLGGSQSDVATLTAEDIDWQIGTISFGRKKTGTPVIIFLAKKFNACLKPFRPSGICSRAKLNCMKNTAPNFSGDDATF